MSVAENLLNIIMFIGRDYLPLLLNEWNFKTHDLDSW